MEGFPHRVYKLPILKYNRIVISNQLTSFINSDTIVVLEEEEVIEFRTPDLSSMSHEIGIYRDFNLD